MDFNKLRNKAVNMDFEGDKVSIRLATVAEVRDLPTAYNFTDEATTVAEVKRFILCFVPDATPEGLDNLPFAVLMDLFNLVAEVTTGKKK